MPRCIKIKKKKQEICIGDMRDEIILQNRAIQPPVFGTPDFTENFTDTDTVFSMINTVKGKVFFDEVGIETPITHEIYIRFDSSVTAETWVQFKTKRIDILEVTSLDERDEYQLLVCTERGAAAKAAAQA